MISEGPLLQPLLVLLLLPLPILIVLISTQMIISSLPCQGNKVGHGGRVRLVVLVVAVVVVV